jgi:hypothetical protein
VSGKDVALHEVGLKEIEGGLLLGKSKGEQVRSAGSVAAPDTTARCCQSCICLTRRFNTLPGDCDNDS